MTYVIVCETVNGKRLLPNVDRGKLHGVAEFSSYQEAVQAAAELYLIEGKYTIEPWPARVT